MEMSKLKEIVFMFFALLLLGCGSTETSQSTKDNTITDLNSLSENQNAKKRILFFGNSLTAGYGIDLSETFTSIIQQKVDSVGLSYECINAGVSGETTASGNSRIDWLLEDKVDVFVLELGGNDGLRGIPVDETQKNLESIIEKVSSKYPEAIVVLAGMQIPPNMGPEYSSQFKSVYSNLARSNSKIHLIPFILEGVGGVPELNLPDGIHPTPEGHIIVANTIWSHIKDLL